LSPELVDDVFGYVRGWGLQRIQTAHPSFAARGDDAHTRWRVAPADCHLGIAGLLPGRSTKPAYDGGWNVMLLGAAH
jgi:hypothetical protein